MKTHFNRISLTLTTLDTRYIRLALIVLALTLAVLGAGAPEIGGDVGGHFAW